MPLTLRRPYQLAALLFLASLLLHAVPIYYTMLKFNVQFLLEGTDPLLASLLLLISGMGIALYLAVGLGLRKGKRWAKGVFLLYFAWNLYALGREAPVLLQSDGWTIIRALLSCVLLSTITLLLFHRRLTFFQSNAPHS